MIDLKPCPFCGGEAALHTMATWKGEPHRFQRHVVCSECKAKTPVRTGIDGEEKAASLWNCRNLSKVQTSGFNSNTNPKEG